ncbi:DegT/DnrJ/EryC1/StrS family aminotransferase [Actinoplanes sp. NEAU-A12]|uniref:DegT/DnrJ/EryC1/StrS family aminotransferase n=1 Tax=Actinoplanes sandaracinus TaxID=3045177 RepID=A0ABT6WU94_9ACTN|nr:DegT/DnrJ/EryC1/StrS family aminotransferase [Actinoplanes sandaracinus]MDI6103322.1 DegT/DnrJ/EryC1/StrS family aminotransferase [Actinoplanes sandaracinus]
MNVPFYDLRAAHADLRAELDDVHRRVLDSGCFPLGPETEAFEDEFAGHYGARHCVTVGTGLDALTLTAAGIGPGDEVIEPSHTFIATWLSVSATGARPVPVEPGPADVNLDPAGVGAAVTSRTRAVQPVHLYGHPADLAPIEAVAARHGLLVIEDAAQARGRKLPVE